MTKFQRKLFKKISKLEGYIDNDVCMKINDNNRVTETHEYLVNKIGIKFNSRFSLELWILIDRKKVIIMQSGDKERCYLFLDTSIIENYEDSRRKVIQLFFNFLVAFAALMSSIGTLFLIFGSQ